MFRCFSNFILLILHIFIEFVFPELMTPFALKLVVESLNKSSVTYLAACDNIFVTFQHNQMGRARPYLYVAKSVDKLCPIFDYYY